MPGKRMLRLSTVLAMCVISVAATAQNVSPGADCDDALGNDYDGLEAAGRQARLVAYTTCWNEHALGSVQQHYVATVNAVRAYQRDALDWANGLVQSRYQAETAALQANQDQEIAEFRQRANTELAEIDSRTTDANRSRMLETRNDTMVDLQSEESAMHTRHELERKALVDEADDLFRLAEIRINQRIQLALNELESQQADKLRYINDLFVAFTDFPFAQSIEDFRRQQRIGTVIAVKGRPLMAVAGGDFRPVIAGDAVTFGSRCRTDRRSSLEIRFDDGSIFDIAENAEVLLDARNYYPGAWQDGEPGGLFGFGSALLDDRDRPFGDVFGDVLAVDADNPDTKAE